MLENIKKKFEKKKEPQNQPNWVQTLSKREKIIIGTTAGLVVCCLGGLMMFNPGLVSGVPSKDNARPVNMPQVTKNTGAMQTLFSAQSNAQKNPSGDKFDLPTSFDNIKNMFGNKNKIPAQLPGFTPPVIDLPDIPSNNGTTAPSVPEYMTKAYGVHAAMSNNMQNVLDGSFTLEKMSDAPSGAGANRFVTVYSANNGSGTSLEKMELVTIAKSQDMKNITSASDALYSLVEDSGSVNIIEDGGSYIIFDVSGSKGYQLTKCTVSDDAITFAAYVNMTTNQMPDILRSDWINKLNSL